jgi:hypothetical protein
MSLFNSQIIESMVSNNTATEDGGAVNINGWFFPVEVRNSTISGNRAKRGGVLYQNIISFNGRVGPRVEFVNSTLAGNQATTEGAGVYYVQTGEDETAGWLKLTNTLLADNDGENCAGNVNDITSLGHNLSDDGFCVFTAEGDLAKVDAKLGPLADNGGPTLTHALLAGSPAINAGSNSACPATDQRGVSRPQGANCDIGAVEAAVTTPSSSSPPQRSASTPWLGLIHRQRRASRFKTAAWARSIGQRPSLQVGSAWTKRVVRPRPR